MRGGRGLAALFSVGLCATSTTTTSGLQAKEANAASIREDRSLASAFSAESCVGTVAVYDLAKGVITVFDKKRALKRFTPASTFKVANSLIALDCGAVKDEHEIIPYGGKPQPFEAWQHDMSMADAIKVSNVAVYQEVARRVGRERMARGVAKLNYGNEQIGDVVDMFWLRGPLAISAVEQVQFLARLAQGKLPLGEDKQAIVRSIMRQKPDDDSVRSRSVIYAKTGWATNTTPNIGWWVGFVEKEGKIYTFAVNIDMAGSGDIARRQAVGKAVLTRLGILEK